MIQQNMEQVHNILNQLDNIFMTKTGNWISCEKVQEGEYGYITYEEFMNSSRDLEMIANKYVTHLISLAKNDPNVLNEIQRRPIFSGPNLYAIIATKV